MSINVSEVIWTIFNFCVLCVLLNFFLYRPIIRFMDQRRERVEAGKKEKDEAEQQLQDCQQQLQATLTEQQKEANKLLAQAKAAAQEQRAAMHREAMSQVEQEKVQLQQQVKQECQELNNALQKHMPDFVATLSVQLLRDCCVSEDQYEQIKQSADVAVASAT